MCAVVVVGAVRNFAAVGDVADRVGVVRYMAKWQSAGVVVGGVAVVSLLAEWQSAVPSVCVVPCYGTCALLDWSVAGVAVSVGAVAVIEVAVVAVAVVAVDLSALRLGCLVAWSHCRLVAWLLGNRPLGALFAAPHGRQLRRLEARCTSVACYTSRYPNPTRLPATLTISSSSMNAGLLGGTNSFSVQI